MPVGLKEGWGYVKKPSPQIPSQPCSQLMSMILIMVMMKKGRASRCTFTRIAVIRNTSRIATRLPRIRTDWEILQERTRRQIRVVKAGTQPRAHRRQPRVRLILVLTSDAGRS